ncbi:MAG: M16 family metallopeptidase [Lachnospiraceae bacterium]
MYERIVLPNGARIVCEHMDGVRSASLGIWVGAGSRYERYSEAGSAHFIEHMLFKGTSRWSAAELAERMDAVGGQMNAYTTRDNTCFYARVLDTHLPLATDTLCAMFFDSRFDERDVENEKGIIQEEIDMYEDTPEDVAAERLIAGCFPGALGRPVLGRSSSLARQTGESLRAFMARHYAAPRVVAALSGSFTDEDLRELARRFSAMPAAKPKKPERSAYRPLPPRPGGKATGAEPARPRLPGLETASSERFALQLLSGILGGNASSRLFQSVRESTGFCYSIYSFHGGL